MTKTHFEEDVHFACDCDITFAIWEFAGTRRFIVSLSCNAFIHGDSPEPIPQDRS
jgi:hypothetical protein